VIEADEPVMSPPGGADAIQLRSSMKYSGIQVCRSDTMERVIRNNDCEDIYMMNLPFKEIAPAQNHNVHNVTKRSDRKQ
jgi:c-di-GMP-binding flagellar brake protein YcgR